MTKEQWIKYRQSMSTVPWETILESGFDAVPCQCNKSGCYGWKLVKVNKPFTYTKPLFAA